MAISKLALRSLALVSLTWSRCTAWHFNQEAQSAAAKPDAVMAALAPEPGMAIADIGSGGGYFTLRFARAVGASGKVYAVDIDESLLEHVAASARKEGLANVAFIQARPDDPLLPAKSVDLVFVRATYHHFADPVQYFRTLRPALRPGARIAIIDYRPSFLMTGHSVSDEDVIGSLRAAGYALAERPTLTDEQLFVVFTDRE